MQLFSDVFKALVRQYLEAENLYAGTITSIYRDDFIDEVLSRDDVVLLAVTPENRAQIREVLEGLATHITQLQQLSPAAQMIATQMAKGYAATSSYLQLKKLFKNAIDYVAQGGVDKVVDDTFIVHGNTNQHMVIHGSAGWQCSCDLFRGKGRFEHNAGECSHIQAVRLYQSK